MADGLLEKLAAKQEITEVIYRYTRGVDRLDMDLVATCFHPGGIDSRPPLFEGTFEEYRTWVMPNLTAMDSTTHFIGNVLIDLRGDEAGVESYYLAVLRSRRNGEPIEAFRGGRYIDRFSRKAGRWAIDLRRAVTDWSRIEAIGDKTGANLLAGFLSEQKPGKAPHKVARDRSDVSYDVIGAI